jgi:excisionase family DNA binding protein
VKITYSTAEVASLIGVSKRTLFRWLYAGKIPEPRRESLGGIELRIWSQRDLNRAKKYKEDHYQARA